MPHKIDTAIRMAVEAFHGKLHRDGHPAILHSLRVGLAQRTKEAQILGYLHDVVEDCGTHWETKIADEFGVEMAYRVSLLTRREKENYEQYIDRVITDDVCILVKIADLEDNMHPRRSDEKARAKAVTYGKAYDRLQAKLLA